MHRKCPQFQHRKQQFILNNWQVKTILKKWQSKNRNNASKIPRSLKLTHCAKRRALECLYSGTCPVKTCNNIYNITSVAGTSEDFFEIFWVPHLKKIQRLATKSGNGNTHPFRKNSNTPTKFVLTLSGNYTPNNYPLSRYSRWKLPQMGFRVATPPKRESSLLGYVLLR